MPYDVTGRPPAEIQPARDLIIRPFSDFGHVGTVDDTAAIQAAVDWSASLNGTDGTANVAVGQPGTFKIDGLMIRHGTRLIAPGGTATKFIPVAAPAARAAILLDTGPVQHIELSGFTLDMSAHPSQDAVYLHAVPVLISGGVQGGLWYARFKDILIKGCTGESLWLHGGDDSFQGPHQFIRFEGVVVESASTTHHALRLSGQVGQLDFDAACRFDGPGAGVGTVNILLERTVLVDGGHPYGVNNGDIAPYSVRLPVTSQSNTRIATVERAQNITFDYGHFEAAYEGIYADVSAGLVSVEHAFFSTVGHKSDLTGWACKCENGNMVAGKNFFGGTVDTHYIRTSGGQLTPTGGDFDFNGVVTSGVTLQLPTTATLATGVFKSVFVNGGSATVITTITSRLLPGEFLTLRANGGPIILGTGGNIDLGASFTPLNVPSGGVVLLARNDLAVGLPWQVVAVSGPSAHLAPPAVFVNASLSPYQALPGTGTIRVDATAGNVTIKLPNRDLVPPGTRITIKKLDATTNSVFINGFVTAQNPDGQADNVNKLTRPLQSVQVERNATVGFGNWDNILDGGTPVSVLTFGTYLTGGPFDGSAPVTIATNATSVNTPDTIVARNGIGAFAAQNLVLAGTLSVTGFITGASGGPALMRGTASGVSGDLASQNLLLYQATSTNWAGIQSNGSGDLVLSVGTAARYSHVFAQNGAVAFAGALAVTGFITGASGGPLWVRGTASGSSGDKPSQNLFLYDATATNWSGIQSNVNGDMVLSVGTSTRYSTVFAVTGTVAFPAVITSGQHAVNTTGGIIGVVISDATSHSGVNIVPATSAHFAFHDNGRVGALTAFRSSNASYADRTWLSVTAAGAATFAFGVTFSASVSVGTTLSVGGTATFTGTIVSNLLPTNATYDLGGGTNRWKDYYGSGKLECGTTIVTGAPAGGTAALWKLGSYITGAFSADFGHAIEVEVAGTLHKVLTAS